jgi:hypothetical protein
MSKLDEKRIMEMMGGEVPSPKNKANRKTVNKKTSSKPIINSKQNEESAFDFKETFLQRVELTDRQPLYLSRPTYEQLRIIVNGIGNNKASMSGYVECIINLHFEQYKDEIIRLFNENIKQPFQ